MNIRYAEELDLPAIIEIYNAAIPGRRATADLEPISVQSRQDWFRAHNRDRHPIWVADDVDDGGAIAAWLSLQEFYGRPAYHRTAEVSIYVAQAWQGKGLGKQLLELAIGQCPVLGIYTLIGFIFGHNTPSLNLFAGRGFEQWGCMPRIAELDGIERDLIVMGLRIAPL